MHRRRPAAALLALALALAAVPAAPRALAQDPAPPAGPTEPKPGGMRGGPPPASPEGPPQGVGREQMWRPPTEEDWAKPVLLTFQRTWEDAVAVAKETGRPILCCINMDGEIASEHYAGVRYREPAIAALYEPFVCVVASVYRHTPKDHDDEGRRILCPRFGSVTCGEHITMEPILYEKYMEGQRIAPRHIMLDLEGREQFDVFYANDTASVFATIRKGSEEWKGPPPVAVRGDRPVLERVGSRHVADRTAVEAAFREGDAAMRKALLEAAFEKADAAPLDLVRLALFGLDPELARLARRALARTETQASVGLIHEALRVPMDAAERRELIAALRRLGGLSSRARWLAAVHEGLGGKSGAVDIAAWGGGGRYSPSAGGATAAPATDGTIPSTPEDEEKRAKALERLASAERALREGIDALTGGDPMGGQAGRRLALLRVGDARREALEAAALGYDGWRAEAVAALAAYHLGDAEDAYRRAEVSVRRIPPGDGSGNSKGVLMLFAEGRYKAITAAVREKRSWPPEWLADLNAVYTVLRQHPAGTDEQVAWHFQLLEWLGVKDQAVKALEAGIERFPGSAPLHATLRKHLLAEYFAAGLEDWYAVRVQRPRRPDALLAFAAEASAAAGDHYRRERQPLKGLEAYGRALAYYDDATKAEPWRRAEFDRAAAFLLGGRARVLYEAGDLDGALEAMLASLARSPDSAGDRDGLNFTPGETAQALLAKLRESKKDDAAARLQRALEDIDPELLRPDRFP